MNVRFKYVFYTSQHFLQLFTPFLDLQDKAPVLFGFRIAACLTGHDPYNQNHGIPGSPGDLNKLLVLV